MSAKSDRIIAALDTLDRDETVAVAGAVLDLLSIDQIIELVLATMDEDGKAELAAHLEDGGAA